MTLRPLLLILLVAASYAQIEEETFRQFFHATFDLDKDGKFNLSDWVAYYKFIEPDVNVNGSHLL